MDTCNHLSFTFHKIDDYNGVAAIGSGLIYCYDCGKSLFDIRKECSELSAKIGQFEQYAELGRLILNGNPCYFGYEYADGDCVSVVCSDNEKKVCKKRAELLAEGGE